LPPGDFNGDQMVDGADYQLWKSTFGSTSDLRADANMNGVVDAADYSIWRNNMGTGVGAGGGSGSGASAVESAAVTSDATAATAAANRKLAYDLSLAAWQERKAAESTLSPQAIAKIEQLGGQVVVVNTPYGPVTRGVLNLASRSQGSGSSQTAGSTPADSAAPSLNLVGVQFSATVSPVDSSSFVYGRAAETAARADSALLLLAAADDDDQRSDRDGDWSDESSQWLTDDGGDDAAFDLALAAAFEDDTDWWNAL
jgi:hypothetical protein